MSPIEGILTTLSEGIGGRSRRLFNCRTVPPDFIQSPRSHGTLKAYLGITSIPSDSGLSIRVFSHLPDLPSGFRPRAYSRSALRRTSNASDSHWRVQVGYPPAVADSVVKNLMHDQGLTHGFIAPFRGFPLQVRLAASRALSHSH